MSRRILLLECIALTFHYFPVKIEEVLYLPVYYKTDATLYMRLELRRFPLPQMRLLLSVMRSSFHPAELKGDRYI